MVPEDGDTSRGIAFPIDAGQFPPSTTLVYFATGVGYYPSRIAGKPVDAAGFAAMIVVMEWRVVVEATKIRVMLADDHRMFREALRIPLAAEPDIEVVAEASTGAETLDAVTRHLPDVLVLDIALPDIKGIEVARVLGRGGEGVKIVALSAYSDRLFVEEMFKAGAQAYVLKSSGADELVSAIRAVNHGHRFLSPELTSLMVRHVQPKGETPVPPISVLGRREQEVLCLLADGRRSAEIAAQLGIATATVDVHRRNIKQKLRLRTTAELTRYAVREGLRSA